MPSLSTFIFSSLSLRFHRMNTKKEIGKGIKRRNGAGRLQEPIAKEKMRLHTAELLKIQQGKL
jgi:hypothetical protein